MAFPVVAGVNTGQDVGADYVVPLPSSIVVGELLLAVLALDNTPAVTWPADWAVVFDTQTGSTVRLYIAYKFALGDEGASITVTGGTGSDESRSWCARITGAHATSAPENASAAGLSSSPDPAPLTPTWGAADTLWLVAGDFNDAVAINSWPPDYAENQHTANAGVNTITIAVATRNLNSVSEDPGTFSINGTKDWITATFAVRPSFSGLASGYLLPPRGSGASW
jgi:hypothetical protein